MKIEGYLARDRPPYHDASYTSFIVARAEDLHLATIRRWLGVDPLIAAARQHQRRRRLIVAVALVVACGTAYGGYRAVSGSGSGGRNAAIPLRSVLAAQAPMIGIACPVGNRTTCGRVGIAVWLIKPASSVTATVSGRTVTLHAGGFGGQGPTYWEGYTRLASSTLRLPAYWEGSKPTRHLPVHLTINLKGGTATGSLNLFLRPGWG